MWETSGRVTDPRREAGRSAFPHALSMPTYWRHHVATGGGLVSVRRWTARTLGVGAATAYSARPRTKSPKSGPCASCSRRDASDGLGATAPGPQPPLYARRNTGEAKDAARRKLISKMSSSARAPVISSNRTVEGLGKSRHK